MWHAVGHAPHHIVSLLPPASAWIRARTAASSGLRSREVAHRVVGALLERFEHRAVEVRAQHLGVDVALAADRRACCPAARRRASMARTTFFFAWACESNASNSLERHARPGRCPAQVRKSLAVKSWPLISRRYSFTSSEPMSRTLPSSSTILEEFLAGQVLARPHDPRQPGVLQVDRVLHAALAAEAKRTRPPATCDVAIAHGRQAVRAVGPGVLVVAHADQRRLQQPHDRGEHLPAGQAGQREVALDARADLRQGRGRRRSSAHTSSRRGPRASAGGSGTASGRARRGPSPGGGRRRRGQIQTSVHAGGIARALIRRERRPVADRPAVRHRR